ncbi:tachykinin-like peptides receptor 86C [Pollicipes pollicipes]|uniref:tachykinin-like peptides receptor 86C n=1 Tax=Pollicipes pollicipes TaxID=41117 RepID=UPI0018849CD7|nr:tachykinin-like peptides receptor 86C [Pollicipes pollicipes]
MDVCFKDPAEQLSTNDTASALYEVPTAIIAVLSVFYGSVSVIAVLGNGLVLWIICTSRRMRTTVNYFIGNLAVADILIGVFSIPFQFQSALLQRWNLAHFMCPTSEFFATLSVSVSVFTLTAIAMDRYQAIVYRLINHQSRQRTKVAIVTIWVLSVSLALPQALWLRVCLHWDDLISAYKRKLLLTARRPDARPERS